MSERQRSILLRLQSEQVVKTVALAAEFDVTEETIRKDLIALEKLGRLTRKHGGAVPYLNDRLDLPLPERTAINEDRKMVIAQTAANLISARETLFLDASSTVLQLANHLPPLPLTVVTNAHHIVVALSTRNDLTLICTGGNYENCSRSYTGSLAEDSSRKFIISTAFLGVDALHPEIGAMDVNHGHGVLKERLIPTVERVIVLADSSKLGARSTYCFAQTNQIKILVTDSDAPKSLLSKFEKQGVSVIIAPNRRAAI